MLNIRLPGVGGRGNGEMLGERVQTFSYEMNNLQDLIHSIVIIVNTVLYTWKLLWEQSFNVPKNNNNNNEMVIM